MGGRGEESPLMRVKDLLRGGRERATERGREVAELRLASSRMLGVRARHKKTLAEVKAQSGVAANQLAEQTQRRAKI